MCIAKVLALLKPYTKKLAGEKEELDRVLSLSNSLNDFLLYVKDDINNIYKYQDESILLLLLKKFKSTKEEYLANKYILSSTSDSVKLLPQYIRAVKYTTDFNNYLNMYANYLSKESLKLTNNYHHHFVMDKYYHLLSQDNFFVSDVKEFLNILDYLVLTMEEKNELLIYVMRSNNCIYQEHTKIIHNDYDLKAFEEKINLNGNLLSHRYHELLDVVDDYVNIQDDINEIVSVDLINKINIKNIVLAKKIWLMEKIKIHYQYKDYEKVNSLFNEFDLLDNILERIKDIKDNKKIVDIIGEEFK